MRVFQLIDPLPEMIVKDEITANDVIKCKQVIFNLMELEARHEALPMQGIGGGRGSKGGGRRDEHYKFLWMELETFLKGHASISPKHEDILKCLLDVRNKSDSSKDKVELDQAIRDLDG